MTTSQQIAAFAKIAAAFPVYMVNKMPSYETMRTNIRDLDKDMATIKDSVYQGSSITGETIFIFYYYQTPNE